MFHVGAGAVARVPEVFSRKTRIISGYSRWDSGVKWELAKRCGIHIWNLSSVILIARVGTGNWGCNTCGEITGMHGKAGRSWPDFPPGARRVQHSAVPVSPTPCAQRGRRGKVDLQWFLEPLLVSLE